MAAQTVPQAAGILLERGQEVTEEMGLTVPHQTGCLGTENLDIKHLLRDTNNKYFILPSGTFTKKSYLQFMVPDC